MINNHLETIFQKCILTVFNRRESWSCCTPYSVCLLSFFFSLVIKDLMYLRTCVLYAVQFQRCVQCRYTLIYGSSREPCTVLMMHYDDLVGSSSIRRQGDLKSSSAKPWAIGNDGWPFYWSNRKAAPFFVDYKVRIHKNQEFELVYQSLYEYILLTKVIRWKVRVPWMSNTQSLRWMN